MADTPQTLALITLAQNYRGNTIRQVNRKTVLLRLLPIVKGEGKNVAFVPEYNGANAENYPEGADASNYASDAQANAILSWGQYRATPHVTGLAMAGAKTSGTPLGNLNLWARNIANGTAALGSLVNADSYTGAGTGTLIAGLDVAIGSTSNTYAGIDRSSGANALWRPTIVDPGSNTLPTFASIRDTMATIYTACGMNPDLGMCSPAVWNTIGSLFDATRRTVDNIRTARGDIKLDAGLGALEIDGCMFMKDKDAPANAIYFLNSNHIRYEYLPPENAPGEPMSEVEPDDGFGAVPLGVRWEMLAKIGDSSKAEGKAYIQLVCDRPNACGKMLHVGTT
jgi:hypothetical protein